MQCDFLRHAPLGDRLGGHGRRRPMRKLSLILLASAMIALYGAAIAQGQSKEAAVIDALKEEVSSLRTQIKELSETNTTQAKQFSEAMSGANAKIAGIQAEDEANTRQIEANLAASTFRLRLASILLMIGLFIEIAGATLLAGNSLMGGIKKVYKASIEASIVDMEMKSVNTQEVADFYAYLGALLLALGFLFQFASTLISLWLGTFVSASLGVVALLVPLAILYYLTGQTPGQSRAQKIRIITHNIRATLVSPPVSLLIGRWRLQCDECLRRIASDGGPSLVRESRDSERVSLSLYTDVLSLRPPRLS